MQYINYIAYINRLRGPPEGTPKIILGMMGLKNPNTEPSPVADPGEGPGGSAPSPLFLDQTEARRTEKFFLRAPLPAYLSVWICHCSV